MTRMIFFISFQNKYTIAFDNTKRKEYIKADCMNRKHVSVSEVSHRLHTILLTKHSKGRNFPYFPPLPPQAIQQTKTNCYAIPTNLEACHW